MSSKVSEILTGSEKPNNSTISKMEQVDKDINVRSKDELMTKGVWNAGYKTGYDKGYKDAQKVKDSQDLVKELVKTFCEDGTWLERQGVYTLTLAEAKQRAVDIIESVLAKDEPTTQTETQNSNLTFEKTERKCIDCNFLTYMFGKTWCNIKCENPHDKVCDRFKPKDEPQTERSEVIEPHGRLIDADAMKESMKNTENNPELAEVITRWIDARPTVIEGSE